MHAPLKALISGSMSNYNYIQRCARFSHNNTVFHTVGHGPFSHMFEHKVMHKLDVPGLLHVCVAII